MPGRTADSTLARDRAPLAARVFFAAIAAQCVVLVLHYGLVSDPGPHAIDWLTNAIEIQAAIACVWRGVVVRSERAAWFAVAAAILIYCVGDLLWSLFLINQPTVPLPSVADIGYLTFYPFAYLGLVLLLRSRTDGMPASVWLDGMIVGLAMAAVVSALVFDSIIDATHGDPATVATGLAYVLGALMLMTMVAGALTIVGLRAGGTWLLFACGLCVFAVFDSIYLHQAAQDSYVDHTILDSGWPVAIVLMGLAAWQRPKRLSNRRFEGWRLLVIPAVAGVVAVALLVRDHYAEVDALAIWLAGACLIAVLLRLGLTFGENLRMLRQSRIDAETDALTGLGNRRRLLVDLATVVERREAAVLALFDLDGFKSYNDTFGHGAGDGLLERLGSRMLREVDGRADAYRVGGDEFCLLAALDGGAGAALAARAAEALSERGEGFEVGCSFGVVTLPIDARTAERALQLADERMYEAKGAGRLSAGDQSKRVLLRAVHERDPQLGQHSGFVADMAVAIACRLGLDTGATAAVRHAAELHDIGKIAVPDSILRKPGPLDEEEWAFMRRHTAIGERIVASAPALEQAARLVRSSHERYDGRGYPDCLVGDEIPLGARIIAVCDSWDAMISDRSYRRALTERAALAELQRCSGTQFDPAVVAVFVELLAERPPLGEALAA